MKTNQQDGQPIARARRDVPDEDFMQAAVHEELTDMQLTTLLKKFRTKTDLYTYLDTHGKCPVHR